MKKISLFLSILILAAGCAAVSVKPYNPEVSYPAQDPANILVYTSKPPGEFIEIGEITVEGASSWSQVERIFKIKSAEIGADAAYLYSKTEKKEEYVRPHECHFDYGYYYPYRYGHDYYFHHYNYYRHYPSRYYYCYGYQPTVETRVFISAVGIAIKRK